MPPKKGRSRKPSRVQPTGPVRELALRVRRKLVEALSPGTKTKAKAPLKLAAFVTGYDEKTLRSWEEKKATKRHLDEEHRGGDRRSADAVEPDVAAEAERVVRRYVAELHQNGQGATLSRLLTKLREVPANRRFFKNEWAVEEFLGRHRIKWRKSDQYHFLASQPKAVGLRNTYILRLVQNRYFPLGAARLL
jgi:hypothetical protein